MKSAVDYTAYEGIKVNCKIDLVIQRGNIIVKDNEFIGRNGDERFIKRNTKRY